MKKIVSVATLALLTPLFALAQFGEIDDFLGDVSGFINDILIPLVFAVALLFFLYGMFTYFISGVNNLDKKDDGKQYIIWSVVGFVLMVSILGVVNLLASGLGFSDDENIDNIPNVPTNNR